jgi:acid phosphatase family membrane protein YuiD
LNSPDLSWHALLSNEILWLTLFAWVLSAILKVLITLVVDRKLILERLIGSGGMPSTHTAPVIALTTVVVLIYGFDHPYFAFGLLLSFLVIFEELISGGGIKEESWKRMTELLGHTPAEIFVGGLIGFLVALIGHHYWHMA